MRFIVTSLVASGLAAAATAYPICTPEKRIEGLNLVAQAFVTGDEKINERVPFSDNATAIFYVQDIPLVLGVDGPSSHNALRLLHLIQDGINTTTTDDGHQTAYIRGVFNASPLGLIDVLQVPAYATFEFDNSICKGYALTGYLYPASGKLLIVDAIKRLFGLPVEA